MPTDTGLLKNTEQDKFPFIEEKKKSEAQRHNKVKTCQNHQRPGRGL